jgi:hypothetical protein
MVDFGNLGGITQSFWGWTTSSVFWVGIIFVLVFIIAFFYLFMARRSKLKYNCIEILRFGNGKIGINLHKAGPFHTHTFANGFIDYGKEISYKLLDGRIIQQAKTSQLHDIMGKKGWICIRKSGDAKILVPIDKIYIRGLDLLMDIAPGDYRDASSKIVEAATKETMSWVDKYLPYIMIAGLIIGIIVSQVISMQMINNAQDKAIQIQQLTCDNAGYTKPGASP